MRVTVHTDSDELKYTIEHDKTDYLDRFDVVKPDCWIFKSGNEVVIIFKLSMW